MAGRLLSVPELLELMSMISHPKQHGLTQEGLEQKVTDFCAGCPDPLQAYRLIAESEETLSDEEVVRRAAKMAVQPIGNVPTSIVPASHPARTQS